MSNRQLDELYEEQGKKQIADLLGISVDDFLLLDHDGIQDETSEDGLIYRHYIELMKILPRIF